MKKILKLKAVLYEDHQISCRAVFGGANAAETGAALREVQDERGDIEA